MNFDNPLFANFGSDSDLEVTGKWIYPVGEGDKAPAFKVARAGGANKKFESIQTNLLKKHAKLLQNTRDMSMDKLEIIREANKTAFVEACLLDWKNVCTKESGNQPVPFNKASAVELFKQIPALYEELFTAASSLSTYQPDAVEPEVEAKN